MASQSAQQREEMSYRTKSEISLEFQMLKNKYHCPMGMYIVPTPDSFRIWSGVLFVHQGYYAGSIVKFRITFPNEYPIKPPSVQVTTDVFHPMIAHPGGEFNLLPRFHPWLPDEHRIIHVLHWIKAAFKKEALDALTEDLCFNKDAYRYRESTSSFSALAAQSAMLSKSDSALFDRDHPSISKSNTSSTHDILFHKLSDTKLAQLREKYGLKSWSEGILETSSTA